MKILFTGGGTGGHIFPIIAICREIKKTQLIGLFPAVSGQPKKIKKTLKFYYLGPRDPFGEIFLSQEGIKAKPILAGKIRRYLTPKAIILNLIDVIFKIPIGTIQAFFHIFFLAPDFIFSKGGFGSLPANIAGWILRVPILLHESDIAPGLANRISSRFSLVVFTSFPKTGYFSLRKMILVGNPIRKEILEGSKAEAKRIFQLTGEKPVVLIFGGSQGAQRINDMVLGILPELLENFEVIHQCGDQNLKTVKAEANVVISAESKKYYHLFSFIKEEELKHAFQASDLIVSRAGSSSISEISALGKPSILIPLPEAAQNHQTKNAYAYAGEERALVIEEANLTPHFFLDRLKYLFSHPQELEKMGQKAKEFTKPKAAEILAEHLLNYLFS